MKNFNKLLTLLFLFFTIFVTAQNGTVIKCKDADTFLIRVNQGKQVITIRASRIDAPEKGSYWGEKATKYTKSKILYKEVTLVYHGFDKYSRYLCDVFYYENGRKIWLQADLIEKGLARHYKYFDSNEILAVKERTAKQKKLGIWKN